MANSLNFVEIFHEMGESATPNLGAESRLARPVGVSADLTLPLDAGSLFTGPSDTLEREVEISILLSEEEFGFLLEQISILLRSIRMARTEIPAYPGIKIINVSGVSQLIEHVGNQCVYAIYDERGECYRSVNDWSSSLEKTDTRLLLGADKSWCGLAVGETFVVALLT